MRKLHSGLVFVFACVGCTQEATDSPIARVDVSEGTTTLAITGIGHDGHEVGRLDLSLGRVTLEDGRNAIGRTMSIKNDKNLAWQMVADGLEAATIPVPLEQGELLADPRVVAALAKWNVTFDWNKAPGNQEWPNHLTEEAPFHVLAPYWGQGACTLHDMPSASGGRFWPGYSEGGAQTACADFDYGDWHHLRVVCSSLVSGYRQQFCNFACINYVEDGPAVSCSSDEDCPGSCNHCDTDNGFCASWEGWSWTGPRGCSTTNDNVGWYYCSMDGSGPHAHW